MVYYLNAIFTKLRYPTSNFLIKRHGNLLTTIKATIQVPYLYLISIERFKYRIHKRQRKRKGYIINRFFFRKSIYFIYHKIRVLLFSFFMKRSLRKNRSRRRRRRKNKVILNLGLTRRYGKMFLGYFSIYDDKKAGSGYTRIRALDYVDEDASNFKTIKKIKIELREEVCIYIKNKHHLEVKDRRRSYANILKSQIDFKKKYHYIKNLPYFFFYEYATHKIKDLQDTLRESNFIENATIPNSIFSKYIDSFTSSFFELPSTFPTQTNHISFILSSDPEIAPKLKSQDALKSKYMKR